MQSFFDLLQAIGNALLHVNQGRSGLVVDRHSEIAQHAWDAWGQSKTYDDRLAELQAVVQASQAEIRAVVARVVAQIANGLPVSICQALAGYLHQVCVMICRHVPDDIDKAGTTLAEYLGLQKADHLLPFLPPRLARYNQGDHPLLGVDWKLEELLGIGGFGEVWKARNPHFPAIAPVALKFCLDPRDKERILHHEAAVLDRVLRQGKHPGIVPLQHTYLSADPPCLEYEYVSGGDLTGLIHEWHMQPSHGTPWLIDQATRVMRDLVEIVAFVHRLNPPIVHRDLKPANILVKRPEDGPCTFHITDFGIGTLAATKALELTRLETTRDLWTSQALRGAHTPLYASPQQKRGDPADPRDDIFALGVIWYQILTGDVTTGRPGGTRWTKKLLEQGMSAELIELMGSCFEDQPEDRPANATILAESLSGFLDSNSISIALAAEPSQVGSTNRRQEACWLGIQGTRVLCVVFCPDGKRAASCGEDTNIHLWDLSSPREVGKIAGQDHWIRSIALSPNGERILSGGADHVQLWEAGSGRELHRFKHPDVIYSVTFSADGHHALAGGQDQKLRWWDLESGKKLCSLEGHQEAVLSVAFSPDGRRALSGSADETVRLWDLSTGKTIWSSGKHRDIVRCVAFAPNSRLVLSGCKDAAIRLWDVVSNRKLREFWGHSQAVNSVRVSSDGRWALSSSKDQTVRLWEIETGREVYCYQGHSAAVTSAVFSPDEKFALSGSWDKTLHLWQLARLVP